MKARKVTGLNPDGPLEQNLRRIVSVRLKELRSFGPAVGDPTAVEALHDMRVAVRRMRTAAKIFGRFLAPDEFRPFARELRALGRGLGPVRDMDVILDHARGLAVDVEEVVSAAVRPR